MKHYESAPSLSTTGNLKYDREGKRESSIPSTVLFDVLVAIVNTAQLNPDRCMADVCNDNFAVRGINLRAEMTGDEDNPVRIEKTTTEQQQGREGEQYKHRYDRWRDAGCPCGSIKCKYHEPTDQEAQCCYGQDGAGDPAVMCCEKYTPDPFVVAAWAVQEDRTATAPAEQGEKIYWPAQCSCGHLYLEKYQFNEPNKDGEIGFCWCGFCKTKRMIKPTAPTEKGAGE